MNQDQVRVHRTLKDIFGYDAFRPGQQEVVDALLAGQDVLAVMPTGAGKSICYQLPALLLPGITVVVSPLISLMQDQVQALIQMGVRAAYINSSLTENQCRKALANACDGMYKIVYVAPERLLTPGFLRFSHSVQISLLCVDEAHCVSQWGQDFRPSYLQIRQFADQLNQRPPLGAFTATATQRVKDDIRQLLALRQPLELTTGFDRPNLFFEVQRMEEREKFPCLLAYLNDHPQATGIVYCSTRKKVDEVYEKLTGQNIAAARYHAGMAPEERQRSQESFLFDQVRVMVATNAFGMGIDKSNVNFVIHYNMPLDLESYYQEAGRAGRDGQDADCILLYSAGDVRTGNFLIDNSEPAAGASPEEVETQILRQKDRLRQMTFYCHSRYCLRGEILKYFGQHTGRDGCGACSVCRPDLQRASVVKLAAKNAAKLKAIEEKDLNADHLQQLKDRTFHSQKVLFPEVVQFPVSEKIIFEKILPEMQGMGFELEDLGGGSYAVNCVPAGLEGLNPVRLVQDMVTSAIEKGVGAMDEINRTLALSLSRQAAIPYGQVLSNVEMENLVNGLFACENVNYTPDGKSVLCILQQDEIEHLLG